MNRLTDDRRVIGFRTRVAHNYDDIKDEQAWDIVHDFLPRLLADVNDLLNTPSS